MPWKKGRLALMAYFAHGRRLRLLVSVVFTLLAVAFTFVTPQIVRITVDSVIGADPFALPGFLVSMVEGWGGREFLRAHLIVCAAVTVMFALLAALANFFRRYFTIEAAEHIARGMRNTLYGHIQELPYEWHVKTHTGDIIQRCTSDVETIRNFIATQLNEMVRIALLVILALAIMFSMDIYMTWITLTLMPAIFIFSVVFYAKVGKDFLKADEAEGALSATVQENLTGVRVVRAFGREKFEMERFDGKNEQYADRVVGLGKLLAIYWSLGDMLSGIQMSLVVGAGIYHCLRGGMSLGTFLSFVSYAGMLIWPVRALGRMVSELSKAGVSAGRLKEILAAEPETDPEDARKPAITGAISFENVTFAYENSQPVLKNVSFEMPAGHTLAILGGTGSGKSTIAHLLCRLYDLPPGSGRILVDGIDILDMQRKWLRSQVGLVLQEPFLFSRTIKENIAATDAAAALEEIRHFAAIAAVDDSISAFQSGYDTVVGERGVTLSGGQKQRVAIARMLMQKTPVMIFDDSLSAVDAETDAKIRHALKAQRGEARATTIIISHRITTLMQADSILVLRDGEVEEMGSHSELLKRHGTYRRIYDMQGMMAE